MKPLRDMEKYWRPLSDKSFLLLGQHRPILFWSDRWGYRAGEFSNNGEPITRGPGYPTHWHPLDLSPFSQQRATESEGE